MKVAIQNAQIGQAIGLLFRLSLKGKKSRHRTRFVKLLNERLQQVGEEEKELLKQYAELDEDGEPKLAEDGKGYDVIDKKGFIKEQQELYEEEMVLEGGDHHGMLKTVKEVLLESDEEFSGEEAMVYDYLCEQFEKSEEQSENEKGDE